MLVENIIPRNMIINLGCASVDNHIPRDDIFDYHPRRECNIYIIYTDSFTVIFGQNVRSNCFLNCSFTYNNHFICTSSSSVKMRDARSITFHLNKFHFKHITVHLWMCRLARGFSGRISYHELAKTRTPSV